jgi:hypothetical protein
MTRANSPLRAIKTFCIECAGTARDAVACTSNPEDITRMIKPQERGDYPVCPLYPFRKGHGLPRGSGGGRKMAPRTEKGHYKRGFDKDSGGSEK